MDISHAKNLKIASISGHVIIYRLGSRIWVDTYNKMQLVFCLQSIIHFVFNLRYDRSLSILLAVLTNRLINALVVDEGFNT